MRRRGAAAEHGLAAVLALLVFAPVLWPGYVLSYDMVATPRVPFTASTLGWGDGLPRAVPQDAVLAVLTTVVPGWIVQLVALFAVVWLAVVGAARAVPSDRLVVRLVAGAAYGWNAFVAERLLIGHWGLLLAYAALPWIVVAAHRARFGVPAGRSGIVATLGRGAPLLAWCALAALTPTGGVIAAVTASAVLLWPAPRSADARRGPSGPDRRRRVVLAVLVTALNAPWVAAGAVARVSAVSDPDGVAAFAARAENWSGPLGAVLGLGGIWNAEVVPTSRTLAAAPFFTVLVLLVAAFGLRPLLRGPAAMRTPSGFVALAVVALGGVVVALLGTVPGGDRLLEALVAHVPGAGLLRDGQKFLAPFALLTALAFALGVERITSALRTRKAGVAAGAVGVAALLFPIAALPDLAWGGAGRLATTWYPDDWAWVNDKIAADPRGELAVLPFSTFRAFTWNGGRTTLDPAPRYFPVDVITEDSLIVDGVTISGESPRAAAVREALADGRSLTTVGIRWVVVERRTPGAVPDSALAGYQTFWEGRHLRLYRGGPAAESPGDSETVRVVTVVVGYAVPVGILLGALASWALTRSRRHVERSE
ncbi:hypothetical protein [Cryptosporangium japonicum]|uniref:Uncharacterized protein n=1 Tax=Cryptosporangium japonicum TaxID=80872 RepID=A0ABP3D012_9ACTN